MADAPPPGPSGSSTTCPRTIPPSSLVPPRGADVVGAAPSPTPEMKKALDAMIALLADEAERKKMEAKGQFRLPKAEDGDAEVVDIPGKA